MGDAKPASEKQIALCIKLGVPEEDAENMSAEEAFKYIQNALGKSPSNSEQLQRTRPPFIAPKVTTYPRELPEKDVMIVRQSCLKAAVELFNTDKVTIGKDSPPLSKFVTGIAEEFERWVLR